MLFGLASIGPIATAMAIRPHAETVYAAPFDRQLQLTAGGYALYESPVVNHITPLTVTVTSSDDRVVPSIDSFERMRNDQGGRTFQMALEFIVPSDGVYRLRVDAPAGTTFIISEDRTMYGWSIAGWPITAVVSGLLLVIGLGLMFTGLVRRMRS
jgi:hypothetical protein